MSRTWLSLEGIPAEGREFTFTDQEIWASRWKEFNLPYEVAEPLEAALTISVQGDGCLVKGTLSGAVTTPCSRCAEDFAHPVEAKFTVYEAPADEDSEDAPEEALVRDQGDGLELNVEALLWEQFLLSMPQRVLCDRGCRGLCPVCGANLNKGDCGCAADSGDPRMAMFRNLKLDKK